MATRSGRGGLTGLGRMSLWIVVAGTLSGMACLYFALDAVRIVSVNPLGDALLWLAGWGVACAVITTGMILACIALVRHRAPLLPAVALAVGVLLAPIGFFVVIQIGVNGAVDEARADLGSSVGDGASAVAAYAEDKGIDLGPLGPIFRWLGR